MRLEELLKAKADEKGWQIVALEVMPDQVHLLVKHDPTSSASRVAHRFKGSVSRVPRAEFDHLHSRLLTLWSSSYLAASVGAVWHQAVSRYIHTPWERL